MRVLELCCSPGIGGLELYFVRSCTHLHAMGDEVLAAVSADSRMRERLQRQGIEMVTFSPSFKPLPLLEAWRLARLIDARGIDVIHMHWGNELPLAALAKRLSRRRPRLVYTRQMKLTRNKQDPYHRGLYRQMNLMLTITEELAESARRLLGAEVAPRVKTLYYGVKGLERPLEPKRRRELRARWGVTEKELLVGLFARMEAFKGQHLLLEALRGARDQGVPLHVLLVGHAMNDEYLSTLKAQVAAAGLGEWVHFEGFTDEIQNWMQACDMVTLTTIEETFGLVLVEAMRVGVTVIGSDRGGVPEIIRHGENGLLFRSGEAVDLQAQLIRCATDTDFCHRLAQAGKQDADARFDENEHFLRLRGHLAGGDCP